MTNMIKKPIPVCRPFIGEGEKRLLNQCIESGWVSSDGPYVRDFEKLFSKYIGMEFGVAVCNGTAALEAALFAINLKPGDEVILPSFTIISCAIAINHFGAKPVLVDIEPDTWNIDVNQIEAKITPKTKAIMAVHMYGHPCDLDPILDLCKKYNLILIEDASQVHGATYKGRLCGSVGHISTFSFYANKIITTGEGGMVLTSNSCYAERAASYRNLCFTPERRFYHTEIGNNLRMTSMQAAIGLAQLEQIDEFVKIKRSNGAYYAQQLSNVNEIKLQLEKPWAGMVYWMYCIQLSSSIGLDAAQVISKLRDKGVETRPFFLGLHEQPVFRNKGWYLNEIYPVTEQASRLGFYVPSSLDLHTSDIDYVVDVLKGALA